MHGVLVPLVIAAIAAACNDGAGAHGGAVSQPQTRWATVRLPSPHAVTISGGSPAQRSLLRQIVATMRPTEVRTLTISPAPADWKPTSGDQVHLTAGLLGNDHGRENSRGEWEAWMIGGAFRDRSVALGLPRLLVLSDAEGSQRVERPTAKQRRRPAPIDVAALRAAIDRAAGPSGHVLSVRLGGPLGATAEVTIQTGRPVRFLRSGLGRLETALRTAVLDGGFIDAFERDGTHLSSNGWSDRLSSGMGGTWDRRYATCVSQGLGGAMTLAPPLPCPSDKRPAADAPTRPPLVLGYASGQSGATIGLGFALQNGNGHPLTVIAITPKMRSSTRLRYTGARIAQPPDRADGSVAALHPPYPPEPPFAPFTIKPGDWAWVELHLAMPRCTAANQGSDINQRVSLLITYRLQGTRLSHLDQAGMVGARMRNVC
jgi:hypothetical protein